MGRACARLTAMLVVLVATVLNTASFILPMWTTSSVVNDSLADELTSADFAAGLWGFCTDVELQANASSANESLSFDHCFFFCMPFKDYLPEIDEGFMSNFSDDSVCGGYKQSVDAGDKALLEYTSALAYVAGLDTKAFGDFLDMSCGPLGWATLVLSALSIGSGLLAFMFLALSMTCCTKKSCAFVAGRSTVMLAFSTTLFTFILWLLQAYALSKGDDVRLNASFALSVGAAALLGPYSLGALHATYNGPLRSR